MKFLPAIAIAALCGTALAAPAPDHWAYQPVRPPTPPTLADGSRVQQPLDAYVIAALEKKGFSLSPPADRETLIRRACFNLRGTPASAEEVAAFVADPDPQAMSALVDRLLADSRFGERWARYWLDVARYADSKGYVFQEERRYAYGYTYRDWVISAFNDDLPYDQFITAQLAADQTLGKENPRHLAAMGFLTLGRRFLNSEPDIIDDRLDVTFRGLQAVTVGCARCHDHKFDPIPTADYYSLYGVFASSEEPKEKPLLGEPADTPEYRAFQAEVKKREQAVVDYHLGRKQSLFAADSLEKYLQLCAEGWSKSDEELKSFAKERQLYASIAIRWRHHLRQLGDHHPVVAPFLALIKLAPEKFAAERDGALVQLQATSPVHPKVAAALQQTPPQTIADVAKIYAQLLAQYKIDQPMPDPEAEAMRLVLMSPDGPEGVEPMSLARDFSVAENEQARQLRAQVESYKTTSEQAPARAMAMVDRSTPVQPVIFKRGSPGARGEAVPRQFLACLSGPHRQPFTQGSGRLELAQAIASRDNPLTARVFVNRTWGWLTGQPLVDTPSDFGVRTAPPANPALLDHLAARFMENGWSMKSLIREIMLSATWQQASAPGGDPSGAAPSGPMPGATTPEQEDPENRLLWKMNRRRRDFESFRDSLLAVSGRLDPQVGGRPVELNNAEATRRTIYGFIDRQNLPGLFRAFDFASPDQHAPKRYQTTVPQQALFALNNPFVRRQAEALAALAASTPEARVARMVKKVLGRNPEPAEVARGLAFAQNGPANQTAGAWEYGVGSFEEAGPTRFTPFPWFGKDRWSGSETLPDPNLGHALVTAGGGHPGPDARRALVLRWHSPETVAASLQGELKRPSDAGDGVRLRLVSSRLGVVKTWDIPPTGTIPLDGTAVELAADDVLDFIVDAKDTDDSDSFQFAVQITATRTGQVLASTAHEFAGPALDPWVAYAQVLLISNEFMFVD